MLNTMLSIITMKAIQNPAVSRGDPTLVRFTFDFSAMVLADSYQPSLYTSDCFDSGAAAPEVVVIGQDPPLITNPPLRGESRIVHGICGGEVRIT